MIKKLLLLLLLFIPVYAYATAYSFNDGVQIGNAYINTSKYSDRNKYLILNNNQRYIMDNNGIMSFSNKFLNGGFLSYREFCIVTGNNSCNGKTYLVIPNSYWTLSGNSTNRFYINSVDGIGQKSDNNPSSVRVTEFVKSGSTVSGNGTFSDPWYFVGSYYISITSNSINHAYFGTETNKKNRIEKYAGTSCILGSGYCTNFDITLTHGYENNKDDGCNLHLISKGSMESDGKRIHKYEISNIKNDIECVALFVKKEFTITFNCNTGTGYIESKTVLYDDNLVIPTATCTKTGYTQDGWTNGNDEKWASGSNIKFHFDDDQIGIKDKKLDLKAKWVPNIFTVQYNGNGSTGGSTSSHNCTYDQECNLTTNGFSRVGYRFVGWRKENSGSTLTSGASIKNTVTGGSVTYYAQWSACPAGTYNAGTTGECLNCPANTYSTGGAGSCTSCPSGYGVASGSGTAQNKCYMSVPAGKYLSAKASSATNCPAGQYRSGTVNITYGSSVGCSNCAANTYSTGGASSCTGCPSGYSVASGSGTAQNKCYMSVPAGWYLNATASSATACPAGQYRSGAVTKYYGESVGCSYCSYGTFSTGGAASCSTCGDNWFSRATTYNACTRCNTWILVNDKNPISNQKWEFYRNCSRVENGWINTGFSDNFPDNETDKRWFYIENGYMKTGWLYWESKWYWLIDYDSDGNGLLDGSMVYDRCRSIGGKNYCFNKSGACTSGPGC